MEGSSPDGWKRLNCFLLRFKICIYLMWSLLAIPLTTIGQTFNRDHTTMIHARDKIMEQAKTSPATQTILEDITKKIKSE